MAPYLLAGIEVPGLQLADMVGTRSNREDRIGRRYSRETLPRRIGDRVAGKGLTQVLVGRNIQKSCFRAVGRRRPILAAPQRRAKLGLPAGPRLPRRVDIRPSGLGIEAFEDVLLHERLAVDKVDLVGGAFEHPQIAVASNVYEALYGLAVTLVVDQDRRVNLVPVPRIVRMILVKALDLPGRRIEGDGRGRIKIVARALVAHPWPAIPRPPKSQVGSRIVGSGDPHRAAAGFPLVAFGPGLTTRLAGGRHRISLPQRLAGFGVERRDKPADPELAARAADHDLAVGDQWRQRHIIPMRIVLYLGVPQLLAGLGIEGNEHRIGRGEINLVAEQPNPAAGRMEQQNVLGHRSLEPPQ